MYLQKDYSWPISHFAVNFLVLCFHNSRDTEYKANLTITT